MPTVLRHLFTLCLLLMFAIVALSSFIRLTHAGMGCEPWPACYGLIGDAGEAEFYGAADPSMHGVQLLHRVLAGALGLAILFLVYTAWTYRRTWRGGTRVLAGSVVLLVLTILLGWLGVHSGRLDFPGVVMGNLAGGFLMLGIAGWLRFTATARGTGNPGIRWGAGIGIILLAGQVWLGGLTSANFAAAACDGFPACQGQWLPSAHLMEAMDLGRQIVVDEYGRAAVGPEGIAVNLAHRWGALVVVVWLIGLATAAWRADSRLRLSATITFVAVVAQFIIGVAVGQADLPAMLVAGHNWIAAMLLLMLVYLLARSREPATM